MPPLQPGEEGREALPSCTQLACGQLKGVTPYLPVFYYPYSRTCPTILAISAPPPFLLPTSLLAPHQPRKVEGGGRGGLPTTSA